MKKEKERLNIFDWKHKWGTEVRFDFNSVEIKGKVDNYFPSQKTYAIAVRNDDGDIDGILSVPESKIKD